MCHRRRPCRRVSCTCGKRITMTWPPCSIRASAASSDAARGTVADGAAGSVSRTGWPVADWTRPVPEVMMSGRSVPASAAPRAAMTRRSFSLGCFWSDISWLNAVWMTPSAVPAASCSRSRSLTSPRTTSAPAPFSASAPASERLSPVTSWPALISSGTMNDPTNPVPPVTNTRILRLPFGVGPQLASSACLTLSQDLVNTIYSGDKVGAYGGYPAGVDATTAGAESGSGAALTGLLRGRLREVGTLIEQRGEAALAGTPLSLPLNHLLDAVVAEPGVTVTEIARRLGKSQQAMSQAADRLERLGFIERHVGAGRTVGLHATDAGVIASADGVRRELAAEGRTPAGRG